MEAVVILKAEAALGTKEEEDKPLPFYKFSSVWLAKDSGCGPSAHSWLSGCSSLGCPIRSQRRRGAISPADSRGVGYTSSEGYE
jgi:hypothetical protein